MDFQNEQVKKGMRVLKMVVIITVAITKAMMTKVMMDMPLKRMQPLQQG